MAKTNVPTGATLIQNVVSEKILRQAKKDSYFEKFVSDDGSSIVHRKRDLEKKRGEKITIGYRAKLVGAGVTEGQVLEGNEEKLTTYDTSLTLAQRRHAVRDDGAMSRKRAVWDLKDEAKAALADWAAEYIDQQYFTALLTSPTKILYRDSSAGAFAGTGTAATAKAAMSATNSVLDLNFLNKIKAWAKTGGNRAIDPLKPVKVDGKDYYVLLVSPNALVDLKVSSAFQTAQRECQDRGKEHPLFQGGVAIWDGVVIHEHENVPEYADGGGSTVRYCTGALLGRQALLSAEGEPGKFVEQYFDYEEEYGIKWGIINAVAKPVFNSKDFGSIGVYLACTNVTGV